MGDRRTRNEVNDSERASPERRGRSNASRDGSRGGSFDELQRTLGNQRVQALVESGNIHPKLTVSTPEDPVEREADRIAERVMSDRSGGSSDTATDRRPEQGVESHETDTTRSPPSTGGIRTSRSSSTEGTPVVEGKTERKLDESIGGGRPLSRPTRSFFEPRFGRDFGEVRVHTGPEADEAARSIDAQAFATGSDIVFRKGRYDPTSHDGRKLIAHELTHVVQSEGADERVHRKPDQSGGREGTLVGNQSVLGEPGTLGATHTVDEILDEELETLEKCSRTQDLLFSMSSSDPVPTGGGSTADLEGGLLAKLEMAMTGTGRPPSEAKVKEHHRNIEWAAGVALAHWEKAEQFHRAARSQGKQEGRPVEFGVLGLEFPNVADYPILAAIREKRDEIRKRTGWLVDAYLSATEPTIIGVGVPQRGEYAKGDPIPGADEAVATKDLTAPSPEVLLAHVKSRKAETFELMAAVSKIQKARREEVLRKQGVEAAAARYAFINGFEMNRFLFLKSYLERDLLANDPELVIAGPDILDYQVPYFGSPFNQLFATLDWATKVREETAEIAAAAVSEQEQKEVLEDVGDIDSLHSEALVGGVGRLVETMVRNPGDKVELKISANIPLGTVGGAEVGLALGLKASAEKVSKGYKMELEVAVGASATVDALIAELSLAAQAVGRIVTQGDSGRECLELFAMGFLDQLQDLGVPAKLLDPLMGPKTLAQVKRAMDEDDYADLSIGARLSASASFGSEDDSDSGGVGVSGEATLRGGERIQGIGEGRMPVERGYTETSIKGVVSLEGEYVSGALVGEYISKRYSENDWERTVKAATEFTVSDLREADRYLSFAADELIAKTRAISTVTAGQIHSAPEALREGASAFGDPLVRAGTDEKLRKLNQNLGPDQSATRETTLKGEMVIKWGPGGITDFTISFYTVEAVEIDLERITASFSTEERIIQFDVPVSSG